MEKVSSEGMCEALDSYAESFFQEERFRANFRSQELEVDGASNAQIAAARRRKPDFSEAWFTSRHAPGALMSGGQMPAVYEIPKNLRR